MKNGWTDTAPSLRTELETRWLKRGHTKANIAKALTVIFGKKRSRNAVIGKMYRVKQTRGEK